MTLDSGPEIVKAPARICIREEREWVVAYIAMLGTMDDAFEISRLSLSAVMDDGGANGPLFQGWKDLMRDYLVRALEKITGTKVAGTSEEPAPPHERTQ